MKRLHETAIAQELPSTSYTDKEKLAKKNGSGTSEKNAVSEEDEYSHSDNEVLGSGHHTPRLGKCEVCASNDARYCCPKCEVKTCCLRCVQIHKKELDCDGIRDRTKFIPLRKMTKVDFMNDYYFLEECTRYVDDRRKDKIKRFTRYNKTLPTHLFRLRGAAADRSTVLRFLLPNFTRHKNNTTFYDWNLRKIFWRVEWVFVNACSMQYVDERCDEDSTLSQLLDKYVNINNTEIIPQKKSLEYYQSAGLNQLKLLLKAEGIKCSRTRYYALDVRKTLRANLSGKTLVEFPCIFVSYEEHPVGCDIIDSDEDVEEETKRHEARIEVLHNQRLVENSSKSENVDSDEEQTARDTEKLAKVLAERRNEARARKRQQFEKAPNNFLFTDEQLWEILSSSSSGDDTEEETSKK